MLASGDGRFNEGTTSTNPFVVSRPNHERFFRKAATLGQARPEFIEGPALSSPINSGQAFDELRANGI